MMDWRPKGNYKKAGRSLIGLQKPKDEEIKKPESLPYADDPATADYYLNRPNFTEAQKDSAYATVKTQKESDNGIKDIIAASRQQNFTSPNIQQGTKPFSPFKQSLSAQEINRPMQEGNIENAFTPIGTPKESLSIEQLRGLSGKPLPSFPKDVVDYNAELIKKALIQKMAQQQTAKPEPQKNIGEQVLSGIEGAVTSFGEGGRRTLKGIKSILDKPLSLRGYGETAVGALETGISGMPPVIGLNIATPFVDTQARNLAKDYGIDEELASNLVNKALPFVFGKWVGAGSLSAEAVTKGVKESGILSNLSPADRKTVEDLVHNAVFLGVAAGGGKVSKSFKEKFAKKEESKPTEQAPRLFKERFKTEQGLTETVPIEKPIDISKLPIDKKTEYQKARERAKQKFTEEKFFDKKTAPENVKENFQTSSRDFKETPGAKESVPKQEYTTLEDGTKVYLVDGTYIRNNLDIDFTMGGHEYVYPKYIPKGEIWLDKDINSVELQNTLRHENTERTLMRDKNMVYDDAHVKANKEEIKIRQGENVKQKEVQVPEKIGGNESAIQRMLSENKTPEDISKALNVPIEEVTKLVQEKPKTEITEQKPLETQPIENIEQLPSKPTFEEYKKKFANTPVPPQKIRMQYEKKYGKPEQSTLKENQTPSKDRIVEPTEATKPLAESTPVQGASVSKEPLVKESPETLTKTETKVEEPIKKGLRPRKNKNDKELNSKTANELLGKIYTTYLDKPETQIKAINDIYKNLAPNEKALADRILNIAKEKNKPPGIGSEQSRIETEKLNKLFETDAEQIESGLLIDERIDSKINRGAKLTPEENKYFEESQYAPKGFKYDEEGNLQKISKTKEGKQTRERIVSQEKYEQAQKNIISKAGQLNAGLDPTMLKDLTIVGAYHFENGVKSFADYSQKMVEEFGEKVKPYLKDIWDEMKKEIPELKETEKPKVIVQPEKTEGFTPEYGETKIRGVARSTEARAIAEKMTEGFKELPEYDVMKNKPQIDYVADIISTDIDKVKKWEFGQAEPPTNLNRGFIHKGLEAYAVKNNDYDLIEQLAKSDFFAEKATAFGREIQSLRNQDPTSPVDAMREIIEARQKSWGRSELTKKATELEKQIQSLQEKLLQKEEQIQKIEAEKAFKKIKRETEFQVRKEKRTYTREQLKEERTVLYQDLYKELATLNAGIPLSPKVAKIMLDLTKSYAKEGLVNAEAVVDAIYKEVKDKIEGITARDIRDAISKYGQEPKPRTKNELTSAIRDLRQQATIISKIEDLEAGKQPFRRRFDKKEPSQELQELRQELKAKLDEYGITEQQNLARSKEVIKNRIDEYNEKISKGDFVKEEKTPATDEEKQKLKSDLEDVRKQWKYVQESLGEVLTKEEAKQITELSQKIAEAKQKMESSPRRETGKPATAEEMEYGRARVDFAEYVDNLKESASKLTLEEFKNKPIETVLGGVKHIPGITKSAKATLDDSALFNQGIKVLMTNPKIWQKNALQSFRDIKNTFGGKNVLAEVSADIVSRPNYDKYRKDKLAVGVVEEAFPDSKLLEKIPYLGRVHKAADAAFTAFAYRNRADLYDYYTSLAEKAGMKETTGIGLGKLVNSLTGRGDLGKLERAATTVNNVFFSPRFLKSHFDVLTAYSGEYLASKIKGKESEISPFVRKQAAWNLMKIVGATAGVMVTAKAMGFDVELDPRSSDFGKIKVGNTRFNFTGGMSSLVTLASRLITSASKSTMTGEVKDLNTGEFGSQTSWDLIETFMQGKLSPTAGVVRDVLKGKTYTGERVTVGNQLKNLTMPLPITNFQELSEDPNSAPMVAALIADGLGIFTNTYSNDPDLRKVKNALLGADTKFSKEKKVNFNVALNKALKKGVITKDQADEYRKEFLKLQKDAKLPEKKNKFRDRFNKK